MDKQLQTNDNLQIKMVFPTYLYRGLIAMYNLHWYQYLVCVCVNVQVRNYVEVRNYVDMKCQFFFIFEFKISD